ncbi:MAG: hypothetical protein M1832_003646 [Thelocarpon impressellum]|nr:MAG: hypothetical protein M1832_003646 [Thelocarpon impressellum]
MASKSFAIIAGVGAGTGACIARRFAKAYSVVLLARNPDNYNPLVKEINDAGGKAVGISADAADADSVKSAFGQISKEFAGAPLAAAVYNVGGRFVKKPFLELSLDDFEAGWEANGRGAFNFSQATLPLLLKSTNLEHAPSLIFTGATASVKANATSASFATGKFALRALTSSLAKEFGPQGVHVGHAIIDGVIDIPRSKGWTVGDGGPNSKISPEGIAEAYWHLHTQPRSCFTWELDLRPCGEKW